MISLEQNLIDLCFDYRLKKANGRTLGELTGKPTCYKTNGFSTVDYLICIEGIFHKIKQFSVKPITIFSYHRQLNCKFDMNISKNCKKNKQIRKYEKVKPRFKYDLEGKVNRREYLTEDRLNGLRNNTDNTDDIKVKSKRLHQFLKAASNSCLKNHVRKTKKQSITNVIINGVS